MEFALAFATVVQLIGVFKAERVGEDSTQKSAFLTWLVAHKHEELKQFILENAEFGVEVTTLLQRDHDEIRADLRALNNLIVGIAEKLDSFAPLAHAGTHNSLSKQALQILIMFSENDGDEMTMTPIRGEQWPRLEVYSADDGFREIGNFPEPRFLDDDLDSLVAYNLIKDGLDENGFRTFKITRRALEFVSRLDRDEIMK